MKYIFFLICLVSTLSEAASSKIYCTHNELCKMASLILEKNSESNYDLEVIIAQNVDPHDFEPSVQEIKKLLNAQILITGPEELNPWIKKIKANRIKLNLLTIELPITAEEKKTYSESSNETLAHFWLYPKVYCNKKKQLSNLLTEKKIIKLRNDIKCDSTQIENKLREIISKINVPIIISHDALIPLFKTFSKNKEKVLAIKGSKHHEEISPLAVKKIYSSTKEKKLIWILEKNITLPPNIIKIIRPTDMIINVETNQNNDKNDFGILNHIILELEKIPFVL